MLFYEKINSYNCPEFDNIDSILKNNKSNIDFDKKYNLNNNFDNITVKARAVPPFRPERGPKNKGGPLRTFSKNNKII